MTKLVFLLTQGFTDWEYAMLAATARQWYGITTEFVGPEAGPVTSAGGLQTASLPAFDPARLGPDDGLILVGGTIWRTQAPDLGPRLAALDKACVVGAICDATRALAGAGWLDAVAHTSNDADTLAVPGYGGAARFNANAGAVRDGRIVTAAGVAPVGFMAEVLAALGRADDNLVYYRGLLAQEHRAA